MAMTSQVPVPIILLLDMHLPCTRNAEIHKKIISGKEDADNCNLENVTKVDKATISKDIRFK